MFTMLSLVISLTFSAPHAPPGSTVPSLTKIKIASIPKMNIHAVDKIIWGIPVSYINQIEKYPAQYTKIMLMLRHYFLTGRVQFNFGYYWLYITEKQGGPSQLKYHALKAQWAFLLRDVFHG